VFAGKSDVPAHAGKFLAERLGDAVREQALCGHQRVSRRVL
jgi:hypothetical protein